LFQVCPKEVIWDGGQSCARRGRGTNRNCDLAGGEEKTTGQGKGRKGEETREEERRRHFSPPGQI
jgi:hypothetical protein